MIKVGDWIRRKGERYPWGKVKLVDDAHVYSEDNKLNFTHEFEPMPTSPQDYIGMRGVFYNSLDNTLKIGILKQSTFYKSSLGLIYEYEANNGSLWNYFIPCETTSTNPEDLTPDKVLTLGPLGVVNE